MAYCLLICSSILLNMYLLKHRRAFDRYHTGALGLTEHLLSCRSNALPRPRAYRRPNITKLRGKMPNHFSASTVWRRLWEFDKNRPAIPKKHMGTTSVLTLLSEDGLPYGMPSGAIPVLHLSTPFGNPPVIQTTVEAELLAQMTSIRKEMARLQEHNNLFLSKVDETQWLLNQPKTQNIQATEPS
ncbi:unnamed protein product [Prunus armeniaca]